MNSDSKAEMIYVELEIPTEAELKRIELELDQKIAALGLTFANPNLH